MKKSIAKLFFLFLFFFSLSLEAQHDFPGSPFAYQLYLNRLDMEQAFQQESRSHIILADPNENEGGMVEGVDYQIERTAVVKLIYGREAATDLAGDYWYYRLAYELRNGADVLIGTGTLEVSHLSSGGIYEQQLRHDLGSSGEVRLKITSLLACEQEDCIDPGTGTEVLITPNSSADLPTDIRLELGMDIQKWYYFDQAAVPLTKTESYIANQESKVSLRWPFVSGAVEYELEYAYWDDLGTGDGADPLSINFTDAAQVEALFDKAIRITTQKNWHELDISYPSGYIYYRVRGIGRYIRNVGTDYSQLKYGVWSDVGATGYTSVKPSGQIQPFETNKSWQFTTSFAEEGKSKKVISYYDGSLRNRQLITYLNDAEVALVAETDYSLEGQPILNILPAPAPTSDRNLFFKANFNQTTNPYTDPSNSQTYLAYGFRDFDKTSYADPLKNSTGAGRYYSDQNDDNGIYRDYIPAAYADGSAPNPYPFTQSEYLRDGSGRMSRQSGVGEQYQLGTGKETRYLYLNAKETELRALFGDNIGEARHYQKNVVLDANGQASVSYIDQSGRVVATALAGQSPANLEPEVSEAATNYTLSLMGTNEKTPFKSSSVNYLESLSAGATAPTHTFTYTLEGIDRDIELLGGTYCRRCEYELKIRVRDPDGQYIDLTRTSGSNSGPYAGQNDIVYQDFPLNPSPSSPVCDNDVRPPLVYTNDAIEFTAIFDKVGRYEVYKELRLKENSVEVYWEELSNQGVLLDSSSYIDNAVLLINEDDCDYTCYDHCYRTLTEANGGVPPTDAAVAACVESTCATMMDEAINAAAGLICEHLLLDMQAQLVPGHAENLNPGVDDLPELFYNFTQLWSKYQDNTLAFQTVDGKWYSYNRTSGIFDPYPAGSTGTSLTQIAIYEQISAASYTLSANDAAIETVLTAHQADDGQFFWQEQWAEAVIVGHREYCFYEECLILEDVTAFDVQLMRQEMIEGAVNYIYATIATPPPPPPPYDLIDIELILLANDPQYNDLSNALPGCTIANFKAYITNKLNAYADEQADENGDGIPLQPLSLIDYIDLVLLGVNSNVDPALVDRWSLYKSIYLDIKQIYLEGCRGACTYVNDDYELHQAYSIELNGGTVQSHTIAEMSAYNDLSRDAQVEDWQARLKRRLEACGLSTAAINNVLTGAAPYWEDYYDVFYRLPFDGPVLNIDQFDNAIDNDDCNVAYNVFQINSPSWSHTGIYSTIGATPSTDGGTCGDLSWGEDIWMKFESPDSFDPYTGGFIRVTAAGGNSQFGMVEEMQIALYDACDGTILYCAESQPAQDKAVAEIPFSLLSSSTEYYLRLGGKPFTDYNSCYPGTDPNRPLQTNQGLFRLTMDLLPRPNLGPTNPAIENIYLASIQQLVDAASPSADCRIEVNSSLIGYGDGSNPAYVVEECFL
ncbi:MAG: hypothetical protein AAFP19_20800, partial [Bacteroidota bacterium]